MSKFDELGRAGKLAAVGGIIVLVGSVLPWYSVVGVGLSGWSSGFPALLGILGGLVGAGILLAPLMGLELSLGSLRAPQVAAIAAGVGVVMIVLRFLTQTSFVSFGLFLSLVGAALVLYAAFAAAREQGVEMPEFPRRDQP